MILRPGQDGHQFAGKILKFIFLYKNYYISIYQSSED